MQTSESEDLQIDEEEVESQKEKEQEQDEIYFPSDDDFEEDCPESTKEADPFINMSSADTGIFNKNI